MMIQSSGHCPGNSPGLLNHSASCFVEDKSTVRSRIRSVTSLETSFDERRLRCKEVALLSPRHKRSRYTFEANVHHDSDLPRYIPRLDVK